MASSSSNFSFTAFTVGLFEITPQNSGMVLAKSSVPISRARRMMSSLSQLMSGRRIKVSVTLSIWRRLVRVWLETWPSASPVTKA
ncbi:Uncharacterised protein [Vibrio cholerae]|nr:Uncharacterised protein [Vibrio cholerae]CSI62125.1 Uncharacterised protein [Vibrio cholerae]